MKKLLVVITLLCFGLLFSCGGDKPEKAKEDPFKTEGTENKKTPDNDDTKTTSDSNDSDAEEEIVQTIPTPPEHLAKAKEVIAAIKDSDMEGIDGKKKYKMFCTPCHGLDGKLNVNGATDLTKSKTSLNESVAQVYHGKGLMTPFKGILKDAEIVAVAKYIEELRK